MTRGNPGRPEKRSRWRAYVIVASIVVGAVVAVALVDTVPDTDSDPNPFANERFYVDPHSRAEQQAGLWRSSRPEDAVQMEKIANQPAIYYFSEWTEDTSAGTAGQVDYRIALIEKAGALPVLGAYAIPKRDCGGYAGGGFTTAAQYENWIREFAEGIGNRKVVVVLEPDALADDSCLSSAQQKERFALVRDAVETLKANNRTFVYIDAGNPDWQSAATIADRLESAGIAHADGFSVNVSNFISTERNVSYGKEISSRVGGKHFIIDTSRNGLGSWDGNGGDREPWCNPPGVALGPRPTANTGEPLVDAYFWMKWPGESDGECRGNPPVGTWMPEYALGLAERAAY